MKAIITFIINGVEVEIPGEATIERKLGVPVIENSDFTVDISKIDIQLCDMCGEYFTGETYKVYNENNQVQRGLISCGCDIDTPDGEEQHP